MKILFCHIPKTAGTSIEQILCEKYNYPNWMMLIHKLSTIVRRCRYYNYVPDYSHMGSILLQVVGKKRFSTPLDTVIVLGVIPPQLGGTALQERHVLVLHAEYPMNAEAGVPVIVRLADNDTEERGLLALVQSVGVTVHVTEKAGEGGVGVDPADAQFPRSLEFCKPEHPGFVSLGGVY
jgi:hypothetical protein